MPSNTEKPIRLLSELICELETILNHDGNCEVMYMKDGFHTHFYKAEKAKFDNQPIVLLS